MAESQSDDTKLDASRVFTKSSIFTLGTPFSWLLHNNRFLLTGETKDMKKWMIKHKESLSYHKMGSHWAFFFFEMANHGLIISRKYLFLKVLSPLQSWQANDGIYPIPPSTPKQKGTGDSRWDILEELGS